MSVIEQFLTTVDLPRMAPVRQIFPDDAVRDVAAAVREEFAKPGNAALVRKGMTIAIGVGSRGLADLPVLVRTTVEELLRLGARPFIVPAMGSHGGATQAW